MRRLRYLLLILALSSLASGMILAAESPKPSVTELPQASVQESPQGLPLYTEAQVTAALEIAAKAAAQTALDKAIPLAVQAAVAEGAAATATAAAERDNWKAEAKAQAGKVLLFGVGGIAAGILIDELFSLIKALISK
jgi:hypothetical protein